MLLVLANAVLLGSESLWSRDHILLSQIRDFPFRRLLRLAGWRWRYSTPPPHGRHLYQHQDGSIQAKNNTTTCESYDKTLNYESSHHRTIKIKIITGEMKFPVSYQHKKAKFSHSIHAGLLNLTLFHSCLERLSHYSETRRIHETGLWILVHLSVLLHITHDFPSYPTFLLLLSCLSWGFELLTSNRWAWLQSTITIDARTREKPRSRAHMKYLRLWRGYMLWANMAAEWDKST
jgi:hypothetical protein